LHGVSPALCDALSQEDIVKLRLETVTNIATLATCVAIGVVLVQRHNAAEQRATPPTYAVGERIPDMPEVRFSSASRTLLLAASDDCRYCKDSAPFYKTVAMQLAESNRSNWVQLVLVTSDDRTKSERFRESSGLGHAKVVHLGSDGMRSLKVPGTPTLILVDNAGKVVRVWVGKLNADSEREVLAALAEKA
jgi:hypothetical protein